LQPLLDAADAGIAIVIDDAFSPSAPKADIIGL
jgi:hypothetical protein